MPLTICCVALVIISLVIVHVYIVFQDNYDRYSSFSLSRRYTGSKVISVELTNSFPFGHTNYDFRLHITTGSSHASEGRYLISISYCMGL